MRFSGEQMYQRRLKQDMSRADLAHAIRRASRGEIKATERGIRGWEKNEYTPHGESVPAIATALSCEINDLYERDGGDASDDDEESDPVAAMTLDQFLEARFRAIYAKVTSERGSIAPPLVAWCSVLLLVGTGLAA